VICDGGDIGGVIAAIGRENTAVLRNIRYLVAAVPDVPGIPGNPIGVASGAPEK
jgi:hypothetical protein